MWAATGTIANEEQSIVTMARKTETKQTPEDGFVGPPSSHPTTRAMRVAGVGDVATYGEELVHHVVRHLLHIVGGFGFVRGSHLARGLRVLASDDDALHGATHRIFDADGDGAVSARDLAVVLSLARPFFSLTHVALEAKFEAALRDARERGADPGNPRGVTRERLAQTLRASPLLDAWTRALVVRAAEWLARRASAQPDDHHENGRATDPQPPPAPPRLRPAPGLRSRREELLGADDAAPRPMTTGRGPDALPAPSRDEGRPGDGTRGVPARPVPGTPGYVPAWARTAAAQFRETGETKTRGERRRDDDENETDANEGGYEPSRPAATVPRVESKGILKRSDSLASLRAAGDASPPSRSPSLRSVAWKRGDGDDDDDSNSVAARGSEAPSSPGAETSVGGADVSDVSARKDASPSASGGAVATRSDSSRRPRRTVSGRRLVLKPYAGAVVTEVASASRRRGAYAKLMDAARAGGDHGGDDEEGRMTQDQVIELKMRREIEEKQAAALSGKAHLKEWDYAAYEHRRRRITSRLENVRAVDIDRITRERFEAEEERKNTVGKPAGGKK